jgi:hypothetical protein
VGRRAILVIPKGERPRPRHSDRRGVCLEDTADESRIGEHVEVIVVPLAGDERETEARLTIRCLGLVFRDSGLQCGLLLQPRDPAIFRPRARNCATSIDHLVGATKQRQRNRQAERLRGPEIDHELELRRLMYREVGGLFAPKNACGEQTSLPVGIEKVGSVACQATGIGKFTPLIDRGPTMADCEHNNLCPLVGEEWIGSDQQPSDGSLRELKNNRSNS